MLKREELFLGKYDLVISDNVGAVLDFFISLNYAELFCNTVKGRLARIACKSEFYACRPEKK